VCLAVSADGERFARVEGKLEGPDQTSRFRVCDARSDRELFSRPARALGAVAFRPDGRQVAVQEGAQVKLLGVPDGREALALPLGADIPVSGFALNLLKLSFSADGRFLAAAWSPRPQAQRGGEKGRKAQPAPRTEGKVWDARTGRVVRSFRGPAGEPPRAGGRGEEEAGVTGLAFRPDGGQLAVGVLLLGTSEALAPRMLGEVQLWDAATGEVKVAHRPAYPVLAVAYSRDGTRLAAVGGERGEGKGTVWDRQGREVLSLSGHTRPAQAVAFSPDGARLATGGDREVRLWDAATGKAVLTLTGHKRAVTEVAFTTDGRRLVTATGFGLLDFFSSLGGGLPAGLRLPMEVKVWDGGP
jgi:WD40 repeat protein